MPATGESAIVVVDIVNDFVSGVFGSEKALKTARKISESVRKASGRIPVVFTMDTHIRDDPEFKVWGEHSVEGTKGAELFEGLSGIPGYRIRKRHFDSFHDSDLDGLLRAMGVKSIYLCGISTDICVLHTASGAYFRYYGITVVEDLCAAIDPGKHASALDSMKLNYGARIISSDELLKEVL